MSCTGKRIITLAAISIAVVAGCALAQQAFKPNMDWAHWRLGHHAELEFLKPNNLTVTFGTGAPNFETISRKEYDERVAKEREFNKRYHEMGYIVLSYVTTALGGSTDTPKDSPRKDQTRVYEMYQKNWDEYADYLGPKPKADPTTWLQIRPDGTYQTYRYTPPGREVGRNFEVWGCQNNPDFVRFMEARLTTRADIGIDGSYIDYTSMRAGTCYCDYCRKAFVVYLNEHLPKEVAKAKYGVADYAAVKAPEKRGEPFWMEWLQYRDNIVAEFHKRMRTAARKYNPNFILGGNINDCGYGLIAYNSAANMEMLLRDGYDDFGYTETQHRLANAPRNDNGSKVSNTALLKYMSGAGHGRPSLFYATEITSPLFPHPTEKSLSTIAQANIAEAAAHGFTFREKFETPPGATQMYKFWAENESKLAGTRLRSNVAVVASNNQFLADELTFSLTTSRVLADRGIGHVVAVEADLELATLRQYDLVVLPYLPLLSAEAQQTLVSYVEQGGKLIILGRTGVKDRHNLPHSKVVLAGLVGGSYPEQAVNRKVKKGQVEFIPLPIPSSQYRAHLKSDLFADIPDAVVRNQIDPDLRKILEGLADKVVQMLPNRLTRLTGNYPFVEINSMVTPAKDRMLVHLVNYDLTLDGDITPAKNVNVEVALPAGMKVRSIEYNGTLGAMQSVKFTSCGGSAPCVRFQADQINIWGLAVLTLQ
ncbi:MAG: beta-galactosidase trimerization domain-containing protein [Acidobacteriia bacterium]|nr:beta-galactosidase trimerization domain-containing protein [Terriglobia bacterium]